MAKVQRPVDHQKLKTWIRKNRYSYWCFISWARGDKQRTFVKHLRNKLREHLELSFRSADIFLDLTDTPTGAKWEKEIAESLCRSVMLVAVYTPAYFSPDHSNCGREWHAMSVLSAKRLGQGKESTIYPLIYWAPELVPAAAKRLQYYDISKTVAHTQNVHKTIRFHELVVDLAERIVEVATQLMENEAAAKCDRAKLPNTSPFRDAERSRPLPSRHFSAPHD